MNRRWFGKERMRRERSKTKQAWTSQDKFDECKDCERRKPGCQDKCEDYIVDKLVNDIRKIAQRNDRDKRHAADGYKIDVCARMGRKKKKEH